MQNDLYEIGDLKNYPDALYDMADPGDELRELPLF